jgi:phenylacetate-coenzyme A ligase PaaK-like adenylate-forming protein
LQRLTEIRAQWNVKIFEQTPDHFEQLALDAFWYQYHQNPIYRAFVEALGVDPAKVSTLEKIPFLPIGFFKTAQVVATPVHAVNPTSELQVPGAIAPPTYESSADGLAQAPLLFESSGTTGSIPSVHQVADASLYIKSFRRGFVRQFGSPTDWCILALLPSYLERNSSSLVYMTKHLIEESKHPLSGFYLHDLQKLHSTLLQLEEQKQPTLLLGVSFALLDLAHAFPIGLDSTLVIETGGMKGRGPELTREELHEILKKAFGLSTIGSEYGMTELLSQGWSKAAGLFESPPWMRVIVREENDPLAIHNEGTGALNIIDLANIDSCCFIATEDHGRVFANGTFEVRGRLDQAELRGCSLLTV